MGLTRARPLHWVRPFALGVTVLCFGLSLCMMYGFDGQTSEMQWVERLSWMPSMGIHYALGIDGFSAPLILLTCFTGGLIVLGSWHANKNPIARYLAAFLMTQGLICGALASTDAILFYIFWEAMLIPLFLIIGVWGSQNRMYATVKFFLYTFLGSVFLLIALIYLHVKARSMGIPIESSFSIACFQQLPLNFEVQKWLFLALFLAFAVKIPMWPVHTWLPDAHVEAPTGGSVILAAVLLKMGGYGFLRFVLPILPDASRHFAWPVIVLSLIAITYIGLVSLVQTDLKKLIAYSSITHMGFVTLGTFIVFAIAQSVALDSHHLTMGIEGAMMQMISHGFVSAGLFFCVGFLYDRLHTRLISNYGGVIHTMPLLATFLMVFSLANIGLPGTSGFVGEFLITLFAFKAHFWYALIAGFVLILSAAYTLWMYKRTIFGPIAGEGVARLCDLRRTELFVLVCLAIPIIGFGVWPTPVFDRIHTSTHHLIEQMLSSKR